jgi:DNA segregation ATPase FtsK/SpoIIIE-like protein
MNKMNPENEELYQQALKFLDYFRSNDENFISPSALQRRLRIGHITANRIIDRMENEGLISDYKPGHPRKILK